MICFKKGNLFDEKVDAYVNAVNCVGVMGKGIALEFKKRYYDVFEKYKYECLKGSVYPGKILSIKVDKEYPKWIIHFFTKNHWKELSKIEYIEKGLDELRNELEILKINSLAMPALGCGLGGLNFGDVKKLIEQKLSFFENKKIIVFEPF